MASAIAAILGLIVLIGSIMFTAIQGNQVATIGVGLIAFAILLELRAIHREWRRERNSR